MINAGLRHTKRTSPPLPPTATKKMDQKKSLWRKFCGGRFTVTVDGKDSVIILANGKKTFQKTYRFKMGSGPSFLMGPAHIISTNTPSWQNSPRVPFKGKQFEAFLQGTWDFTEGGKALKWNSCQKAFKLPDGCGTTLLSEKRVLVQPARGLYWSKCLAIGDLRGKGQGFEGNLFLPKIPHCELQLHWGQWLGGMRKRVVSSVFPPSSQRKEDLEKETCCQALKSVSRRRFMRKYVLIYQITDWSLN